MTKVDGTSMFYPLWLSISVIIYWLSYVGLFQSSIFTERKNIRLDSIQNKDITINQISDTLNFPNQSGFGRFFKKCEGISPLEYRRSI